VACTPEIESALDAVVDDARATEATRLSALSEEDRTRLQQTIRAMTEVLHVGFVFFAAFQDAAEGGEVSKKLPEATRSWVQKVDRRRSGGLMASIVASGICGHLEGYIVAMTPLRVTAARIGALRTARAVSGDHAKVLKDLSRRVKPTTNQEPAEWVRALREAFDVTLEPAEERMLHRNLYSHNPSSAVQRIVSGADVKCWWAAAMNLCHRIGAPAKPPAG
jgi:hypothetical protein